jgi:nucleolar protein 58
VVSKLKGDALKYKGIPIKVCWFRSYEAAVSNHHLRIAKKKLLGSLVKKAKKAYEAEQAEVCEKGKLQEVVRRSSRLNPKLYEKSMLGLGFAKKKLLGSLVKKAKKHMKQN